MAVLASSRITPVSRLRAFACAFPQPGMFFPWTSLSPSVHSDQTPPTSFPETLPSSPSAPTSSLAFPCHTFHDIVCVYCLCSSLECKFYEGRNFAFFFFFNSYMLGTQNGAWYTVDAQKLFVEGLKQQRDERVNTDWAKVQKRRQRWKWQGHKAFLLPEAPGSTSLKPCLRFRFFLEREGRRWPADPLKPALRELLC